jgi:hypothetical protein
MSKKSLVRSAPFVTVIVLIVTSLSLACICDVERHFTNSDRRQATAAMQTKLAIDPKSVTEEAQFATQRAQTHATQTMRAEKATWAVDLTEMTDTPDEVVKATLFAEEACIVKEGEGYSWENTEHQIVEGDGVTSCKYRFIVRNTSDADQHLIICETSSTGSDGTQSEGWRVRHLGAHGTYEADYSYVDYHGRSGDQTWAYATSLLIVRKVPECFWLTPSDDPKIVEIWEAYATSLENPCK